MAAIFRGARWPADEPFSAAPPLDGAGDPNALAGSPRTGPVSGLEVGIIVGVVLAVTILLLAIFLWRARRNKKLEQDRLAANMIVDEEACSSIRPSRDDHHSIGFIGSIVDTDKILTTDQPEIFATMRTRSINKDHATWADWDSAFNGEQRQAVEEHEMAYSFRTPKPCTPARS